MGSLLWYPGPVSPTSNEHKREAHSCQRSRLRFGTALTSARNRNIYRCASAPLRGKEPSLASKELPATAILSEAAATAEVFSLYHLLSSMWQIFPLCFVHFALAPFNWKLIVLPKRLCSQLCSPGIHHTFYSTAKADSITDINLPAY